MTFDCDFFISRIIQRKFNIYVHKSSGTVRAVFTYGPKGPGPRAANFQGRHIKKIGIEVWYAGKEKAVHER
jgi:hypothetical protein